MRLTDDSCSLKNLVLNGAERGGNVNENLQQLNAVRAGRVSALDTVIVMAAQFQATGHLCSPSGDDRCLTRLKTKTNVV